MKKYILQIILIIYILIAPFQSNATEYVTDLIIVSNDGIWTDARSYTTLNSAISGIGANERTILIPSPQTVTTLTVPSNVSLRFIRDGAINNSGQLTINSKNIIAGDRQIFTGSGDIDFIQGSTVRSAWFADIVEAFDVTNDDRLTLIISAQDNINANTSVGNEVSLKWESQNNRLLVDSGFTLSNIKNIEAGKYQIFTGAGDFDFLSGTELKLSWFRRLRSVITWVETEEVTLILDNAETLNANITIPSNITVIPRQGSILSTNGYSLAVNGPVDSTGKFQWLSGTNITVKEPVQGEWFGVIVDDNTVRAANTAALELAVSAASEVWLTQNGTYYLESFDVPNDNFSLNGRQAGRRSNAKTVLDFSPTGSIAINAPSTVPLSVHSKIQGFSILGPSTKTGIFIDQNGLDLQDINMYGFDVCIEVHDMVGQRWENITVNGKTKGVYLNAGATGYISNNVFTNIATHTEVTGATAASVGWHVTALGGGVTAGNNIFHLDSEGTGVGVKTEGFNHNIYIGLWVERITGAGVVEDSDAENKNMYINTHFDAGAAAALTWSPKAYWHNQTIQSGNLSFRTLAGVQGALITDNIWTNTAQPMFSAQADGTQTNIAVGSWVNIEFATEIADQGSNYATPSFTAPVTGLYQVNVSIYAASIDTVATNFQVQLLTSNRPYYAEVIQPDATWSADATYVINASFICDMDAADTATARVKLTGGAAQTDINSNSFFSAVLLH